MGLVLMLTDFLSSLKALKQSKKLRYKQAMPILGENDFGWMRLWVWTQSDSVAQAKVPLDLGGVGWKVTLTESLHAGVEGLGGSGRTSSFNSTLTTTLHVTKVSPRERRLWNCDPIGFPRN